MFILDGSNVAGLHTAGGSYAAKLTELQKEQSTLESLEAQRTEDKQGEGQTQSQTVSGGKESTEVQTAKPQGRGTSQAQVDEQRAIVNHLQSEVDRMRDSQDQQGQQRADNRLAANKEVT